PLPKAAAAAGVEIYGEVELAWRLRPAEGAAPWLALTGTNGKTTVVRMLASILRAAGHRTLAVGNVGTPIVEAAVDPSYDVLAVGLSSLQPHWSSSRAPSAAAVLTVAPDHIDRHGSRAAYAADKGKTFGPGTFAVVNAADPVASRLAADAARRVAFTLEI